MTASCLPTAPGTYILVLEAARPATIAVGRLGTLRVEPGWYLYTGSALGAGGLAGRLRHHLRPAVRPHWHIDYLRQVTTVRAIWYAVDGARWEHRWASLLAQMAAPVPCAGFGASDCACAVHCFCRRDEPAVDTFAALARAAYPDHLPVSCCVLPFPVA